MKKSTEIRKKSKCTQLIVFEKSQKTVDFKRCKVCINAVTKNVILTPCGKEKEKKDIVLDFYDRSFVQHEKILFILATGLQDDNYIIIFSKQNICKRIIDVIQKVKNNIDNDNEQIRQKCLNLLKQTNIDKILSDTFIYSKNGEIATEGDKQIERNVRSRKRKMNEITFGKKRNKDVQKRKTNKFSANKIIRPPAYQVVKRNIRNKIIQKLVIFDVNDRNLCYEYTWSGNHKTFQCKRCQHNHHTHVNARVIKNSLKGEYVQLGQNQHKCTPIQYVPENLAVKAVYLPNFLLEDVPHRNGGISKRLTIFDENNKSIKYIYTYRHDKKIYQCNACAFKHKYVIAKVRQKKENDEIYFELNKTEHVCNVPRKKPTSINVKKIFCKILKNEVFTTMNTASDASASVRDQQKKIELVSFDKNCYQGSCKLQINKLSKLLIVEPIDEEFKMISASFDWQFLQHYNTLFVKADYDFKNFALIFDSDRRCNKVYNFICKNKGKTVDQKVQRQLLNKTILLPFVNEISKHGIFDSRFKEIAHKWIKNSVKQMPRSYTKEKESSKYLLVYSKEDRIQRRYLILFTSTEKAHCYEYSQNNKLNMFYCLGCREKNRQISAKLENNCLMLCKKQHICAPKLFVEENYIQIRILKEPEYEIIGKCLVIFDSNNRELCFEFLDIGSQWWVCRGCKALKAVLRHKGTETEYLEIGDSDHGCKKQEYKNIKDSLCKDFVLSPNFEVRKTTKKGFENKELIIFNENGRKLCYIYRYISNAKYFLCRKCEAQKKWVTAKVHENSDGEQYVILCSEKHVCEMQPYKSDKEIIIRPPDFELIETTSTGTAKLFIFDSTDRSLCYIFSPISGDKSNRYNCIRCRNIDKSYKTVQLCKDDENGNYYVVTSIEKCRHVCKPQKYNPELFKPKKVLDSSEYFFIREKKLPKLVFAGIRHPTDKTLCYKFLLYRTAHYFVCCGCEKEGKRIPKKIHQDENGNPYFYEAADEHICEPVKIESLQGRGFRILKNDEIDLTKNSRVKKQPIVSDKSKVIEAANFELHPNKNGVPDQKIIIFHTDDKNLRWEFWMMNKSYRCHECALLKKRDVIAKLYTRENGEKYIILGDEQHICEPIRIEPEKKIVDNYLVIEGINENETAKLLVFTSPSKEFCYKMLYHKGNKHFQCYNCASLKQIFVGAKLCKNLDGTEYFQMRKHNHICEPLKYVPENPALVQKANVKIIRSDDFELQCNQTGVPNRTILVFTSKKKDFVYRYLYRSETLFRCSACSRKHHYATSVKLCEDETGQYLECSEKEHVCKPQKYEPSKK